MSTYKKEKLGVVQAASLRELVEKVNKNNEESPSKILKEDIVYLSHKEGDWFLLYYK